MFKPDNVVKHISYEYEVYSDMANNILVIFEHFYSNSQSKLISQYIIFGSNNVFGRPTKVCNTWDEVVEYLNSNKEGQNNV